MNEALSLTVKKTKSDKRMQFQLIKNGLPLHPLYGHEANGVRHQLLQKLERGGFRVDFVNEKNERFSLLYTHTQTGKNKGTIQAIAHDGTVVAHANYQIQNDEIINEHKGYGDYQQTSDNPSSEVSALRSQYEGQGIITVAVSIIAQIGLQNNLEDLVGDIAVDNVQSFRSRALTTDILTNTGFHTEERESDKKRFRKAVTHLQLSRK